MRKIKTIGGASADAVFLMAIKLVTIMLNMVITRLLSEHLSVYDYGTYSQVMLIVSTVSSITILGMMDGVNYFHCSVQDEDGRETCVSTIFTLQCIVGAIAGAAVLLLTEPLAVHFENPDLRKFMILAAVLPCFGNLLGMFQVLLVSVGKARMLAVRNLIVSLIRLWAVMIVIAVVKSVAVILITTLVLDIAQITFFVLVLRKNGCKVSLLHTDFTLFGNIFRFCAPMAVFTIVNSLSRDLDKYVIALFTDTETLAIYSNASKLLPFDIIMASFCTVLLPEITRRVANKDKAGAKALYKVFLEIAYISNTILCCGALATSPQLMKLLYSNKYQSGIIVFCIYILVDLVKFTNITLILSAAGKTVTLMLLGGGALALNGVLNVLMYQWLGIVGPALATLITTLLLGIVLLCLGARELHTRVSSFFDCRFLILFLLENALLLFLFSRIREWLAGMDVHYFVITVTVFLSYVGLLMALHGKRLFSDLKKVNTYAGKS